MQTLKSLALADMRRVIEAAEAKAAEIKLPGNIAIAIDKACAARAFDAATKARTETSGPDPEFYGSRNSNHGRVMIFAGGIPLRHKGAIVGVIAVSGGRGKQVQAAAERGAAAL